MPQLLLEMSSNVKEQENINHLLQACHAILADRLPTDLASCKSRAIIYDTYCVGDGNSNNALVNLTIKILTGRTQETLTSIGNSIMAILKNYFIKSLQELNLQITIEISELPQTYLK
jgi:5-carboxymethyl-2-hydroxymuconate isomerase